ncbi:MAG: acylneuraminate cytidylyltransferase family protein [Candidatus Azambacteria bacterium]|nr:acylneuraminate cytidylyltransferase family protein [Candidatus Azambacteria bacterium]
MKTQTKIITIITARDKSRGIPNKNIKAFCGKPLIAWTIIEALKSKLTDRVIVSTDSKKIAEIAKHYSAETPFIQPKILARPSGKLEYVLKFAIDWLKKNENYNVDYIVWLLPTNPLRLAKHIDEAIKLALKKNTDCVVAASELPISHNPYWVFEQSKSRPGTLINAKGQNIKNIPHQRQLLPKYYTKNDIVFIIRSKNLRSKNPTLWGKKQELYKMSDFYDADINTPEEWTLMENKFKRLKKGKIK